MTGNILYQNDATPFAREAAELGAQMHRMSTFHNMHYSVERVADLVSYLAEDADGFFTVAVDSANDQRVVGYLIGANTPSFFGDDWVAGDLAVYVHPEYRKEGVGDELVRRFVQWATARGAKRINVGNSTGMDDTVYVRLMLRHGFSRAGSLMYQLSGEV